MKKIIQDIINSHYFHYHSLYENFAGLIEVMPVLNEVYHISNMFDKCIDSIILNLERYNDEYQYTGWNLNNIEKICERYDDCSLYIPIYLKVEYDINNADALSVTDKDESPDRIQLTINTAFERNSYTYDLRHELFHALQMYIVTDKNPLTAEKTHIDFKAEEKLIKERNLTRVFLDIADNIIYCCSKSEQDAQLQATIPFLKARHINRDKKTSEHIVELISESEEYNRFYKFKHYYDKIEYWWSSANPIFYGNLCTLAYFYKKYSGDKLAADIEVDEDFIKNLRKEPEDKKEKISGQIFKIISDSYADYKRRLYELIFVHCIQNNENI